MFGFGFGLVLQDLRVPCVKVLRLGFGSELVRAIIVRIGVSVSVAGLGFGSALVRAIVVRVRLSVAGPASPLRQGRTALGC